MWLVNGCAAPWHNMGVWLAKEVIYVRVINLNVQVRKLFLKLGRWGLGALISSF